MGRQIAARGYHKAVSPGDLVASRYRLDRLLGAGGMSTVWAATHLVTHKSVALKFVDAKKDAAGSKTRALREARAACAVRHPDVLEVHDVVEASDGAIVLVMDLLQGESLAQRLAREETLSVADALRVVRPVLSALAAAHAAGVVHRDLKPDNIFLLEDGGVKILDFGVAKLRGVDPATRETHRLTETGAMIGTPHYMAPEQAFGERDVDARADLWAIGAVLYECLSGVPPTNGENLGQILKALATGDIRPVGERAPATPRVVAEVVDALLQTERERRPASAAEVLAALDAAGSAEEDVRAAPSPPTASVTTALSAPARTTGSGTGRLSRRWAWLVGIGAAAALASTGAFVARRAPPQRAEPSIVAVPSDTPPAPAPSASPAAPPVAAVSIAPQIAPAAASARRGAAPARPNKAAPAQARGSAQTPLLTDVPF